MVKAHVLGYPSIGDDRKMKKAFEAYCRSEISQATLETNGKQIRANNWEIQMNAGLDFVTAGDFSFPDFILNMSLSLGIIPERFQGKPMSVDTALAMARGKAPNGIETEACEMTKWFNTNYHYIVPEFTENQEFHMTPSAWFNHIKEAESLGHHVKPVLIGPLTLLWLGKIKGQEFNKLQLLDKLLIAYNQILHQLQSYPVEWLQMDEPILTLDLTTEWKEAFSLVYKNLKFGKLKCLLTTYFGGISHHLSIINQLPIHGLHVDLCSDPHQLPEVIAQFPEDKILSLGVINGRNIWRTDLSNSLALLKDVKLIWNENLWIGSSCSLLHVPVDLNKETRLDAELKSWLAFAKQKVDEIALLAHALNYGEDSIKTPLEANKEALASRRSSPRIHNKSLQEKIMALTPTCATRNNPYNVRIEKQNDVLKLPLFPTTTIGSFPQTQEIRVIRRDYKSGKMDYSTYIERMKNEIAAVIKKQEALDLDILVHGEAERNDMVEYFGELLNGFAFTQNGWVQSYGSRCVKPPIIYGDVSRISPMTVDWTHYAQSLTTRPLKGMLTGPITILSWSFERDDQSPDQTALQIALALREEVLDLEKAGIKIIQIDEPAFREALPLRKKDWPHYLDWAVHCFRIASCGVQDQTQIHTHMCYSEFNDVIDAIAHLDADVITIECSQSQMELLTAFEKFSYPNEIGPGIYDIHSPRIPTTEEVFTRLEKALHYISIHRLWVNPDCGLKTRDWFETEQSLKNMVDAAKKLREKYSEDRVPCL